MKKSHEMVAERQELQSSIDAIIREAEASARDLTVQEKKVVDQGLAKLDILASDIQRAQGIERQERERMITAEDRANIDYLRANDPLAQGQLYNRRPNRGEQPGLFAERDHAQIRNYVSGLFANDPQQIRNAMSTHDNALGGFIVPTPMADAIIELRQQRGVARRNCMNVPMTSSTLQLPKFAGEVTAYFTGENEEITESTATLSQVMLEARKIGVLVPMSSELAEDAVLVVAEMLTRSVAYAFATKEDECLFNGDATSTYGHILGLKNALLAGSKHTATGQTSFGALTLGSFEAVVGKAKRWASAELPKWYFSREGYFASAARLMNAAGGNSNADLASGASEQSFMGYPVEFVDCLHSGLSTATGQVACYFGDLRTGAYFGSRRQMAIAVDGSARFTKDQLLFRATTRIDINPHDRGTADEAGGIVGLIFG